MSFITNGEHKTRILIVSQYFWPENFRINDLAQELEHRGHEVTVLTGKPNYPQGLVFPDFKADPSAFSFFGTSAVLRVPVIPRGQSSLLLLLNYLSFAISASLIGAWKLRGRPFDAIFVFQTSPITAALPAILLRRLKRATLSMWILDLWPDTLSAVGVVKSRRMLKMISALVRFVYHHCDRILVQSRAFVPKVAELAGSSDKIRYFPGWAETVFENAASVSTAPELAPYDRDFKILFAGNIGEAQDFPAIVDAADQLRDVPRLRWIILGDGRAAAAVKAEIARRGLEKKMVFLGRFALDRMPSFFAGADALLVALRDEPIWSMTIPGKVQSYLAAGRPLLAMLNGEGARVVNEAEAGLTAPAGDGRKLAANVTRLMKSTRAELEQMGCNGQAYGGREFDRRRLVDALEGWMAEHSRNVR